MSMESDLAAKVAAKTAKPSPVWPPNPGPGSGASPSAAQQKYMNQTRTKNFDPSWDRSTGLVTGPKGEKINANGKQLAHWAPKIAGSPGTPKSKGLAPQTWRPPGNKF